MDLQVSPFVLNLRWWRRKWRHLRLGEVFWTPIEVEVENGGPSASGRHLGWPHLRNSVSYHHVINHIPKMPLPHAKGTISWPHHLKWHHFHATPHIPLVGNKLHHMGAWCLFYKQEVMSCRGSTKAQSQDACFSWTSDTGKWTLTWYVPAPLCLNPWKCLNPFLGDPIRVRTTFLTKFYNKTGTIMPSFLNVFNPLFSGPIRDRATFLTKSYNKTGTITSSFLKVSNPLFNGPIRVRTTFLSESYNKTGTITS